MRIDTLASKLGMPVNEVFAACDATKTPSHDGALTNLRPSEALMVVGWLPDGRFDDARRAIQAEVSAQRVE